VREALIDGDTGTATHMLSRDYAIEGWFSAATGAAASSVTLPRTSSSPIISGQGTGSTLCAWTLDDESEHPGVASLGVRPTFEPAAELLEAHLFGFEGDLYDRKIEVALHAFIREEKKFESLDDLVAHMRDDEAQARTLLALE
jgi:riboflavin kinase/FMN adenylyltransferase